MASSVDPEELPLPVNSTSSETTPLLASDARYLTTLRSSRDWISRHLPSVARLRHPLQDFLTSKWGHYFVLLLVSLDVGGIFADFLISLHVCEHSGQKGFDPRPWEKADKVLDVMSLVFSCLFMAELAACIFAFGLRYFRSKFHVFDATVIVAAFVVDVLLRGPVEEAGSLIVIGRLWRVFKIIEEFSTGAEEQMDSLQEMIEQLEREKEKVVLENEGLRRRVQELNTTPGGHE